MKALSSTPLLTLTLDVAFDQMTMVGPTPAGLRRIAPVTGGTFEGPRLSGTVLGGHDWVINRPDGVMMIDVRLTLQAAPDAMIYLTYQGRFSAPPAAMKKFATGALLDPSEYSLAITAKFETGAAQYTWLNDLIAVGTGTQTRSGPVYEIFSIG